MNAKATKAIIETRTLVLIVAYEAERHIQSVLDRLPDEIWNARRYQVLCIDDASSDQTTEIALAWKKTHSRQNLLVLRNPVNQGYGGNQKLGYQYALEEGLDYVVLLHGDGQYAPELVPEISQIMSAENADVYLGVRTWSYLNARSGGMPRYKFLGNKFLTWIQNRLTGKNLVEYHTGLRGYSSNFLRQIPFGLNSNDFHFDTEVLLQSFYVDAKIVEHPIPVHYGDEVCRVNGTIYAWQVFLATLRYALIRTGLMNSTQYRRNKATRYLDKTSSRWSSHGQVLTQLRKHQVKRILDIGCGNGFLARRLIADGHEMHGLDRGDFRSGAAWTTFRQADLDHDDLDLDPTDFDALLCLDVIEHLKLPEKLLLNLRRNQLRNGSPLVFISTPNVAFLSVRLSLLFGYFNYSERGILDLDHSRLFSKSSLLKMVKNSGYEVLETVGIPAPWDSVLSGRAGKFIGNTLITIHGTLAKMWPSLFAFQILVICRPSPSLLMLMELAKKSQGRSATEASQATVALKFPP